VRFRACGLGLGLGYRAGLWLWLWLVLGLGLGLDVAIWLAEGDEYLAGPDPERDCGYEEGEGGEQRALRRETDAHHIAGTEHLWRDLRRGARHARGGEVPTAAGGGGCTAAA